MAIDFPASPTNGQTFTSGSVTYTYDGTKWTALASGGGSQWTTSGSNIYYNTGSVGIGSTLAGNSNNSLLIRRDSASAISNVLMLNNGPANNNAGQGVRINMSGIGEADSNIRYAYIEAAHQTSGNDHYLAFGTNPAGATPVERARIDSSGRLLVGTSTARTNFSNSTDDPQLQIESSNGFGWASIRNSNSSGGAYVYIAKSRGTGNVVLQNNDIIGGLNFEGNDGSEFVTAAQVRAEVDGTPGANDMPGRLVFSVSSDGSASPTERMRVRNDGWVGIFSATETLSLRSAAAASSTSAFLDGRPSATNTTDGGSSTIRIYTNGNVVNTNNSYGSISDIKLKENIVDANSQWNDLKALQVRNYNFKEGQTHTQIGLIAQEVELVSPGLVSETPDRDEDGNDLGTVTKSVNYSVLYMKAVKALQEAMERIEALEAKVAAFEAS